MKKFVLVSTFFFILLSFTFLDAQWVRTYGGSGNDRAKFVLPTRDGGFIIAGETELSYNGESNFDVWLLKLDMNGNIEWQKAYHWIHLNTDYDSTFFSMWQTNDGGYIVTGYMYSYLPEELWMLKLDSSGNIIFFEFGRFTPILNYFANFIEKTADGGFILMGNSSSDSEGEDFWVLKLSQEWDIEGRWAYGGDDDDRACSVQQTSDGGYILTGNTLSFGAGREDIWVLKLSLGGNIEWQRTYGGVDDDIACSVQQTSDGGYILAGNTLSFGAGREDIWVLKLSQGGDIEWQRTYGGDNDDRACSVQQTSDGGYIIGSNTQSFDTGEVFFLILKLTNSGDIEWQKILGAGLGEKANTVKHSSDGGYIVAGSISSFGAGGSDFWVLKLLQDGNIDLPCRFIKNSNAQVIDTYIKFEDINLDSKDININFRTNPRYEDFATQNTNATVYELCSLKPLLTILTASGGTTDPAPGTYIYDFGTEVIITAIPDSDVRFNGWSGDASGISNPVTITLDSDKSVTANFDIQQYKLTIAAGEGGTTEPKPGTYTIATGTEIAITALPESGYRFSGWSDDISGLANPVTIILDSNKTVMANFLSSGTERSVDGILRSKCFIASAAYGPPYHPFVKVLRDFRDKYLMPSKFGRAMVKLYNKYSPFVANFIAKHKALKVVVRLYLLPLVAFSYSMVHIGLIFTAVVIIFISMLPFLVVTFWRRNKIRRSNKY